MVVVTQPVSAAMHRADTDAMIIEQALRQPERFEAVFDRHYRHIYAYAARRLGGSLAEDVAAETFLIAFDRRTQYDVSRHDARPWLYGIASNLIARHGRAEVRQYRALTRSRTDAVVDGHADMVAGRLDAQAVRGPLARALAKLAAAERDVLLLVAWAGLSCQEAAIALDIPAGTARSRLHRARKAMRAALGMNDSILDSEVAQ
jgi:RNA polymerase sigma factor (sigma-70 family)